MVADMATFTRVCSQYRKQCVVYVEHFEALSTIWRSLMVNGVGFEAFDEPVAAER